MIRQTHVSLQSHHSFRCPSIAEEEVRIQSEEDLLDAYQLGLFKEPWIVLGHGTNSLFLPKVSERVFLVELEGFDHESLPDDQVLVRVGAGVRWDDVVEWSINQGYGGIEAMIRIPGTCGAAPVQNIGAYGQELNEVLMLVRAFDTKQGVFHDFTPNECGFSYRDSMFKKPEGRHWIITSISMVLKGESYQPNPSYPSLVDSLQEAGISSPTLKDIGDHVAKIRASKLPNPTTQPNAGSFFKNPILRGDKAVTFTSTYPDAPWFEVTDQNSFENSSRDDLSGSPSKQERMLKIPAGWLIEQTGLKGVKKGHVGVWAKQALVLYHEGEANGADVLALATMIQEEVQKRFDIVLEREVRVYGSM